MPNSDRRVPTNLITGFLGTGKTTAILDLLQRRPAGQRWGVFINEYGIVSIDHAVLSDDLPDVQIQELGGGCFCCTTAADFPPLLLRLLHRARPDRLIIEPSGAGHPARVIDLLRAEPFRSLLDLRATIALIDPNDLANPRVTNRAVFHDQIQMADVAVINWTDKRDPQLVADCRSWIERMAPPKLLVAETRFGRLDPAWLDLAGAAVRLAPSTTSNEHRDRPEHPAPRPLSVALDADSEAPARLVAAPLVPGRPLRFENSGQGQWACGWIFSPEDRFDRDLLFDLVGDPKFSARLKGLFHCDDDWWLVNRTGADLSFTPSAYRGDSRLEIILDREEPDWTSIERRLLACLRTSTAP